MINMSGRRAPSFNYPASPMESSMARTYNPGYASYTGDGSGRDSYVITNNGGLARENKRAMQIRK